MSERGSKKAVRQFYEKVIPPSPKELARNLQTLNKWLGMEELTTEELEERVRTRIEEQNLDILPARLAEGKVTPEWQKYARKQG